jgi:NAD(P)-dependent dehydrogenase (short-subunit alcohol dehydrogenase family)
MSSTVTAGWSARVEHFRDVLGQFRHDRTDQFDLGREVPVGRSGSREPARGDPAPRPRRSVEHREVRHRNTGQHGRLDLLINNAGLAMVDQSRTVDGVENRLRVNYLGHRALTLHLLPLLTAGPPPGWSH